jgi:putative phage-type endonuclease
MNDFQRNTDWYLARKGMITASEIANILVKGRGKDEIFGKTAISYLNDKIAERLMDDEMFIYYMEDVKKSTPAMRWGTEYESTAIEQYELALGVKVMDCPFMPLKGYEKFVGGSPDGRRSSMDRIIEVKCPFNPTVHIEHCRWNKPEDLKAGNLQYYAQVQVNMLDTKTELCDFISYSPLFRDGLDLHVLEVPLDNEFCDNLMERIDLAVAYIEEQMKNFNIMK